MSSCKWGYKSPNMYSYPAYDATYKLPMNLQVGWFRGLAGGIRVWGSGIGVSQLGECRV